MIKQPERVSDEELKAALASDPFHSQFDALYGAGESGIQDIPEDNIWVDPDLYAEVDSLLDVEVDVEHFPSEESLLLVNTAQEWLDAARATETLLGAAPAIDVERIEDLRAQYDRAPECYNPAAADVRFLIAAIDALERSHMGALVELHRTILRLDKQINNERK